MKETINYIIGILFIIIGIKIELLIFSIPVMIAGFLILLIQIIESIIEDNKIDKL